MSLFRFRPAPLGCHCQALTGRDTEPSGLGNGSPRAFASGALLRIARRPKIEMHPMQAVILERFS